MTKLPRTSISAGVVPAGIKKLKRRLADVTKEKPFHGKDWAGDGRRIAAAINATMDDVFGAGTADAADFRVEPEWFIALRTENHNEQALQYSRGLERARAIIGDAVRRLEEKALDAEEEGTAAKALKAYNGLDLHPEIARAANDLYRDGHYANAIEDAVKALNAFVRLRSSVDDRDGSGLMEYVFNPKNPVLAFNELKDDSDRDEQKGFMMMLSGAVAGLRNPRAHRLTKDDPERALEFIAYVSLLAKLVDDATRRK